MKLKPETAMHVLIDKYETLPTGSSIICPEQPARDFDWVVLGDKDTTPLLEQLGFTLSSQTTYPSHLKMWRYGTFNVIVVDNRECFDRWNEATQVAKARHLCKKEDRIRLFKEFLYEA